MSNGPSMSCSVACSSNDCAALSSCCRRATHPIGRPAAAEPARLERNGFTHRPTIRPRSLSRPVPEKIARAEPALSPVRSLSGRLSIRRLLQRTAFKQQKHVGFEEAERGGTGTSLTDVAKSARIMTSGGGVRPLYHTAPREKQATYAYPRRSCRGRRHERTTERATQCERACFSSC